MSSLKNLKRMNALSILSGGGKSGHGKDAKKAIGSTQVVTLTLSIFISLLMILTVMTLALGSGG
jgi:hypothetical protein